MTSLQFSHVSKSSQWSGSPNRNKLSPTQNSLSPNRNQLIYAAQQQMAQAGLTYAQTLKEAGNKTTPYFELKPAQILQPQTSNINIQTPTFQNQTYPYYTNLQPQQHPYNYNYPNPCNYSNPYSYTNPNYQHPQQQQQQHIQPQHVQPRVLFDQKIQNNVSSVVSQYYDNKENDDTYYRNLKHVRNKNLRHNKNNNRRWRNNNNYQNNRNNNRRSTSRWQKNNNNKRKASGDVRLCWIYKNVGKCRFGDKCEWLHLERDTGKYEPTMYMKGRKINRNADDDNKEEEKDVHAVDTTFDRNNVCWEFNTFAGCRKGSKCKWPHQYLLEYATHPFTGAKLNGMAIREFHLKKRGCC